MELTTQRSSNLASKLFHALSSAEMRAPLVSETEPAYTRRILSSVIKNELMGLNGIPLAFRGDGGDARAIPATVLDIPFLPDMAVSLGGQNIWAAEVKFLRSSNRQNSIATAIGQATIYRGRYEHVAVVLIDLDPVSRRQQRDLISQASRLGVDLVVRSRLGPSLLPQF